MSTPKEREADAAWHAQCQLNLVVKNAGKKKSVDELLTAMRHGICGWALMEATPAQLNFMLSQVIPNIQSEFTAIFAKVEADFIRRPATELKDLIHQASEVQPTEPFSRRLAANTVAATAEKILEERKRK